MKPTDLLDATRPILMESSDPGWPYYLKGAGFLACLQDIGLLITAKHVLKGVDPNAVLVFPGESRTSIKFGRLTFPLPDDSFADLLLMPFFPAPVESDYPEWRTKAVPLTDLIIRRGRAGIQRDPRLHVIACPADRRGIDYDQQHIAASILNLEALWTDPDGVRQWIHKLTFAHQATGCEQFGGCSGSPVYSIQPPVFGLAGILIEASDGRGHMIDSAVLWSAAQRTRAELLGDSG